MKNYLKDQGGQFWGAFGESLAKSLKEERDRPLKEAMMKAQIGHQQAIQKKMEMDIRMAEQQQADVENLANVLRGTEVPAQPAQPAQVNMDVSEGDMPVVTQQAKPATPATRKAPSMDSPEVRAALVRAGSKGEVTSAMAKASFPNATVTDRFGVTSMEEAAQMEQDPLFRQMFSHGHRWDVKNGKLVPVGINPVNAADNEYHAVLQATRDPAAAQAARNRVLYGGAYSSGMGTAGGTAAAAIPGTTMPPSPNIGGTTPQGQQPGQQAQATPTPAGAPNQVSPGVRVPPRQAGETDVMYAARLKSLEGARGKDQAQAEESLVALADAKTMLGELEELSKDLFKSTKETGYLQRGKEAVGQYAQSFDPASQISVYESRKQTLGENLARSIGGVKGTATEGDIKRMLIAFPKIGDTSESAQYKIKAFNEIVDRAIVNKQKFINGEPIDLTAARAEFRKLADEYVRGTYKVGGKKEEKKTAPAQQGGQNIIHHEGKQYVIQNGALFEVRK